MHIKHNKITGSVTIEFSWKEIFVLILKRKIFMDKELLKNFNMPFLNAMLENINNNLDDNKK